MVKQKGQHSCQQMKALQKGKLCAHQNQRKYNSKSMAISNQSCPPALPLGNSNGNPISMGFTRNLPDIHSVAMYTSIYSSIQKSC